MTTCSSWGLLLAGIGLSAVNIVFPSERSSTVPGIEMVLMLACDRPLVFCLVHVFYLEGSALIITLIVFYTY